MFVRLNLVIIIVKIFLSFMSEMMSEETFKIIQIGGNGWDIDVKDWLGVQQDNC